MALDKLKLVVGDLSSLLEVDRPNAAQEIGHGKRRDIAPQHHACLGDRERREHRIAVHVDGKLRCSAGQLETEILAALLADEVKILEPHAIPSRAATPSVAFGMAI